MTASTPEATVAAIERAEDAAQDTLNFVMANMRANRLLKLDPAVARAAHAPLFAAPPVVRDILPSSEATPRSWRFVTTAPATDWYTTTFDDSGWNLGNAGFGAGRVGGNRAWR